MLSGMTLRQTTGFVKSLMKLVDLEWTVPDFGNPSRRQIVLRSVERVYWSGSWVELLQWYAGTKAVSRPPICFVATDIKTAVTVGRFLRQRFRQ